MTVTKDLCSWCSFDNEQLVQACVCVVHVRAHLWLQFCLSPEGA